MDKGIGGISAAGIPAAGKLPAASNSATVSEFFEDPRIAEKASMRTATRPRAIPALIAQRGKRNLNHGEVCGISESI
jgi:hypothetical protein